MPSISCHGKGGKHSRKRICQFHGEVKTYRAQFAAPTAPQLRMYTEFMRATTLLFVVTALSLLGCGESPTVERDGRPFDLWEGRHRAIGTVLIFTRSDCPISNRYAPTVRSLCQKYQNLGIDFFLVYVDRRDDAEKIKRHLEEYQYPCPGLHDPAHQLVAECGVSVTPEAAVFDSQHKIVYRGRIDNLYLDFGSARGEATTHELADALEAVASKRPVSQSSTTAVGCYIVDLK
jgi:hypothetical protein